MEFIGQPDLVFISNLYSARHMLCGCVSADRYMCQTCPQVLYRPFVAWTEKKRDAPFASQLT